ncbi:hypothetical protein V2J09_020418 [Rumex salicifolius]
MSPNFVPVDEEGEDEQTRELREIFRRFDMDSDGSITLLELAALLRSLGLKPTGDQLHTLLSAVDANGNGSVEFDELVTVILPGLQNGADTGTGHVLGNQEELLETFRSFDRDGNGVITPAELVKAMAKMGERLSYKELADTIKEADANGDGVISFNEFASIMARSVHLPA